MDLAFNDRTDTSRKLHNCIGMYENVPVSISVDMGVADINTIRIKTIPNGRARTIQSDDPLFEARFMPLGYVNTGVSTLWLSRSPLRRMQLGISDGNIVIDWLPGTRYERPFSLNSTDYLDLFSNKYPPYEDAIKMVLADRSHARAISREVALGWLDYPGSMRLYYRNVPVGIITPKRKEKKPAVQLYDTEFQSFIIVRLRNSGIPYVPAHT